MFGPMKQLDIDDVHRGASDVMHTMDERLASTRVGKHIAGNRRLRFAFRFPKLLPGRGVGRDFHAGAVARVNVIRRASLPAAGWRG